MPSRASPEWCPRARDCLLKSVRLRQERLAMVQPWPIVGIPPPIGRMRAADARLCCKVLGFPGLHHSYGQRLPRRVHVALDARLRSRRDPRRRRRHFGAPVLDAIVVLVVGGREEPVTLAGDGTFLRRRRGRGDPRPRARLHGGRRAAGRQRHRRVAHRAAARELRRFGRRDRRSRHVAACRAPPARQSYVRGT